MWTQSESEMTAGNPITCQNCGREVPCEAEQGDQPVRCACGQVVQTDAVDGTQEELSAEDMAGKWFYEADDQRYGPVPLNTLRQFVAEGKLGPDNLLWRRGMDDWTPVSDVSLVADALSAPVHDEAPTQVYEIPEPRRTPATARPEEEPGAQGEETASLVRALSGLCYLTGGGMVVAAPVLLYFGIEGRVSVLWTVGGTLALAFCAMLFLGAGQFISMFRRMADRLQRIESNLQDRFPGHLT
jgi:hypothetical protein